MVCGPTASGKSGLGIEIAKKFGGEIVSADSMQIYKEMSIGTAKPSTSEMEGVIHHLIDIISVSDEYNVSQFVFDAQKCIDDIISKKRLPVIVGGTGLYIDSLINNVNFQSTDGSVEIREDLKRVLSEKGPEYLYDMLLKYDADAAKQIHKNNTKRVMRALEIVISTGKTLKQVNNESLRKRKYSPLFIGLNYLERENLYNRINCRVDLMLEQGLLDEVKYISGLDLSSTASGAIGYKELFDYLNGECSLESAVELLKQKTRNYAKRQLTWFKRNKEINWFYPDSFSDMKKFTSSVLEFISNSEV